MGSQGVRFLRACVLLNRKYVHDIPLNNTYMKQQIRQIKDELRLAYRKPLKPFDWDVKLADLTGGFFWWWTTYNILTTDYVEFFGPFPPDPSKWTDEELGIPPLVTYD